MNSDANIVNQLAFLKESASLQKLNAVFQAGNVLFKGTKGNGV